jgi:molybdopterin-guanine dinucleotide biosynthesis protein A
VAPAGAGRLTVTFSGAVLCGGSSRRMGRDKATLLVDGTPMAGRVAAALREAGAAEVFAVGGDADALESIGLSIVADDEPGEGPFPATLTALRHASSGVVVVLSCDLLAPSATAIGTLVDRAQAAAPDRLGAVPVVDGHEQWTHMAWRREALDALEEARRRGVGSLRRACADLPLVHVPDLPPTDLADADQPGDLPGSG